MSIHVKNEYKNEIVLWLFIISVSVIVLGLFSRLLMGLTYDSHVEIMKDRARDTLSHLQYATPYLNRNKIQSHLEKLASDSDSYSYILIMDKNAVAIAHSNPERVGMSFDEKGFRTVISTGQIIEQIYTRDADNPSSLFHGEKTIDILAPVFSADQKINGVVNIGISLKAIEALRVKYILLSIVGILIWTALIIAYALLRMRQKRVWNVMSQSRRENEERFHRLIQNSNDVFTIVDEKGVELFIAGPLEKIFGYKPEELLGTRGFDLMHPDDREATLMVFAEALAVPGSSRTVKYRYRHKDGNWIPVEVIGTNLLHDQSIKGIVLNVRDISERIKVEATLKTSQNTLYEKERMLSNMISTLPGVVYQFNVRPDGTSYMSYVSEKSRDMLDMDPDDPDFVENITNSVIPEDRQRFTDSISQAIKDVAEWQFEGMRIRQTDGLLQWFSGHSLPHAIGDEIVYTGFLLDITDRKLAQKKIAESQEKFSRVFNLSPDMMGISRISDGKIMDGNQAFTKLTGYTREEFIGNSFFELGLYADPQARDRIFEQIRIHGELKDYEIELRLKSGEIRHCIVSIKPISVEGEDCLSYVVHDISRRKKTEQTIKALNEGLEKKLIALTRPVGDISNIELSELFDINEIQKIQDSFAKATGVASIITEPDGTPITRPSNFCHLCENIIRKTEKGLKNCYHSDAILGSKCSDGPKMQHCLSGGLWDAGTSIFAGDKHIANWLIGQVLEEPVDEESMLRYAREIGADEEEFCQALKKVTRMPLEQFTHVSEFLYSLADQLSRLALQNIQQARFITERREAEDTLRESEERFRTFIDNSYDALFIHDLDGSMIDVNETMLKMYGVTYEEALKYTIADYTGPENSVEEVKEVWKLVSEGENQLFPWQARRPKDGSLFDVEVFLTRIFVGGKAIILGNVRDITERKQFQKRLEESERTFRQAIEILPLGCVMTGITGEVVYVNKTFTELFGYTVEDIPTSQIWMEKVYPDPEYREQVKNHWLKDIERLSPSGQHDNQSFILDVITKDQRKRIVEFRQTRIGDQLLIVSNDITEQKQAEEALIKSEELFRNTFENHSAVMLLVDPETGNILKANQAAANYYGWPREKLIRMNIMDINILTPDEIKAEMDKARTDNKIHFEFRHRKADGSIRDVSVFSSRISTEGRDVLYSIVHDITERKKAEFALKESQARFERMAQKIHDGLSIIENGKLVFVNDRACEILGYSREEMAGIRGVDLAVEEHKDRLDKLLKDNREGKAVPWEVDFKIIRKDGEIRHIHNRYSVSDSGSMRSFYIMTSDITERMKALDDLRESEETFRALSENSADTIMRFDKEHRHLYVNPTVEKLTGIPWQNFIGKNHRELGFPDNLCEFWGKYISDVFNDGQVARTEFQLPNGIWMDWLLMPEFGPSGEVTAVITSSRDITERKVAEEALRMSEAVLKESQRIAHVGSWHLDIASNEVIWSEELYKMYGFDPNLPPPPYTEHQKLFTPDSWVKLSTALKNTKETGVPYEFELETVRKDGSNGWMWVHGETLLDASGKTVGLRGAAQDITERKRSEEEKAYLEAQLQQAQKMESVGRLAGGVAHDFNNLLTSISGNVELALSEIPKESGLSVTLSEVRKASLSAAALIKQLLAFSRKQIIEPRVVDLNLLISNMHKMLSRLIGEDIELETLPHENLKAVKIDPSQFEQILVNLAVNARDAMPQGGVLTIETTAVDLDEEYCHTHAGVSPGSYVMLAVSDTGSGMSEEVRQHIFEPFFTTKSKSEGTGLGLATTYGAVKQAGGTIEVYSEPGEGSTFKIYLPVVDEKAEVMEADRGSEVLLKGSETVLLVEDEQMVRTLAIRLLKKMGYNVIDASNGRKALEIVSEMKDRIDLLMTDVVMPGMNGRQLAEKLKEIHPETKVLFTSGYTENIIAHHGVVEEGLNFIGKPYSMNMLARKIREILDGKGQH